jgi:hypothetical protein
MIHRMVLAAILALGLALSMNLFLAAQQPGSTKLKAQPKAAADRLEFVVVQSFDAKYEGDTPGHSGRIEDLHDRRPQVALGDLVYRGEVQIGQITELGWSPVHGTLEVEFEPAPVTRICVGDRVWLYLEGPPAVRAGR